MVDKKAATKDQQTVAPMVPPKVDWRVVMTVSKTVVLMVRDSDKTSAASMVEMSAATMVEWSVGYSEPAMADQMADSMVDLMAALTVEPMESKTAVMKAELMVPKMAGSMVESKDVS